jgi:hypothetical protein
MSNRVHDEDGNLIEQWDDESRKYTRFNEDGSVAGTPRDYNDDENADADRLKTAEIRIKNEESLKQQLDASLDALQVILDDSKSNINADPASRIKDIARALKKTIRIANKRFEGTG